MKKILTYSKLIEFDSFEDRFNYAKLDGAIGTETFGFSRYINQLFYSSYEWKKFRRSIILRDNGCDLGIADRSIIKGIEIHHLNPICYQDIVDRSDCLMDPENVICVSSNTHKAIHYGDLNNVFSSTIVERKPNDTAIWRR
jgi:hypothetical protein